MDKRIAVMQPYIFPYIGYFQLIEAVNTFVFYDDVNFIKQGWVNRNKILLSNKDMLFSVPVKKISSFSEIKDTKLDQANYDIWSNKFKKSLTQSYRKAPFFDDIYHLICKTLDKKDETISELAINSISRTCDYLGIHKVFKISSIDFSKTKVLERTDRLLTICKMELSNHYINPSGGTELYDKNQFLQNGIKLSFIKTSPNIVYSQGKAPHFLPNLSIIDVLMWNSRKDVLKLLKDFTLV